MRLETHFIDTFTNTPFKGNPAAVVVTDSWLADPLMQLIATENSLSETAFLVKNPDSSYSIRWFSPIKEIDFCGHATLASAFVLFNRDSSLKELLFQADAVGRLTATRQAGNYIQMGFPNRKPEKVSDIPAALTRGLSIEPSAVYRSQQAYFAVYRHEQEVLTITQSAEELTKLAPFDVVVTAPSVEYDFVSRYFWPFNGGDEDPVTGSIHAGLAPLWADRLGKIELSAYQASARGGKLLCEVQADRVLISGQAVQYLQGHIDVPA